MNLNHFGCFCAILTLSTCVQKDPEPMLFGPPLSVTVTGYKGDDLMEPFISRDGKFLFFNNLNKAPDSTFLHWAAWKSDRTFEYKGKISGVNTDALQGTPTMDKTGNLYFVSTRNYATSLSTVYTASFLNGAGSKISLVGGISRMQPGIVNFDVEINASGDTMYFVDGEFDSKGNPVAADIVVAKKISNGFERLSNSADVMKNINTADLEYAASISPDDLTIYFTRAVISKSDNAQPQIFYATRKTVADPFDLPILAPGLGDFVEAPSISGSGKLLYYHSFQDGTHKLFLAKKGH